MDVHCYLYGFWPFPDRSQNAPRNFVAYFFSHNLLGMWASTHMESEIPIVKIGELPQRAAI